MYAKNYGPGQRWLPGKVVEMEGSVMCSVELTDGRIVRRHFDQLRVRIDAEISVAPDAGEPVDSAVPIEQDYSGGETTLTLPDATEPQTTTETEGPSVDAPTQADSGDTESPETPETDETHLEESSCTVR